MLIFTWISTVCVLGITPLTVFAQESLESEPFAFHAEPSPDLSSALADPFTYQGEPIVFNGFRLWPNLTLEQRYTDNLLATENNTQSDFITVLKPELEIWKSLGRHDFSLLMNSEILQHWDRSQDNVENYNVAFNADLEARQGLNIPIKLLYRDGHLRRAYQRRSNADQIVKTPLNVKRWRAESGFIYKPNRLMLSLLGDYSQVRLGNEELINGGFLIRDNRDVNITQATGKVSYDLKTGLSPFVQTSYTKENYINETPGAVSRNNDSLRILAGADFNFKGLIAGFIGAGIDRRSYDDATVGNTGDVLLDAEIYWDPIPKTRLRFDARRETTEDNLLIQQLTETAFGLGIDHELRQNLFARLAAHYGYDEFMDTNRQDKTLDSHFELLKIIGPHLQLGAGYQYLTKDSSVPGLDMDQSVVFLRIKTAL